MASGHVLFISNAQTPAGSATMRDNNCFAEAGLSVRPFVSEPEVSMGSAGAAAWVAQVVFVALLLLGVLWGSGPRSRWLGWLLSLSAGCGKENEGETCRNKSAEGGVGLEHDLRQCSRSAPCLTKQ